jgi:hypothetical protein
LISDWLPGVVCGISDFETMSKMPALERSAYRTESKVALKAFASPELDLKSAAARRMELAPDWVWICSGSCARAERPSRAAKVRRSAAC